MKGRKTGGRVKRKMEITADGVILLNGMPASPWVNSVGYLIFKCGGAKLVHREIAKALIPNPLNLSDVNHKDGNKLNNHPSNLEWMSRSENLYHALRTGLHDNPEMPIVGIHEKTGKRLYFVSQAAAGRAGFTQANISYCLSGRRPRHKGYKWAPA